MITTECMMYYDRLARLQDEYLEFVKYSDGRVFEDHFIQSRLMGRYEMEHADARNLVWLVTHFCSHVLGKALALARAIDHAKAEWEEKAHEELRTKAIRILEENPYRMEWGQDAILSDNMVREYFDCKRSDHDMTPDQFLEIHLFDVTDSNDWESRSYHASNVLHNQGFTYEELCDLEESHIEQECPIDMNIGHFLDQDVNVRFELISNYDCINSAFFETDGFIRSFPTENTYLGDVLLALHIDPAGLNEVSETFRFELPGDKPRPNDSGPLVDDRKFVNELTNMTCGANLLTIPVKIPFRDLANKTFTIPQGTPVGFYSDSQGGGSIFQCVLLKDFEITLPDKPTNNYPWWRLTVDCDSGYSMVKCYGSFPE